MTVIASPAPRPMLISVDLSDPKPVYQQIADAVRVAIAHGTLQPGDRLPAIRETAVQARVNRNTVSRAYLELEHQGLVRSRQGSGFFVTDDGARREHELRRASLPDRISELVLDARLSGASTEELVQMVRDCARSLDEAPPQTQVQGDQDD